MVSRTSDSSYWESQQLSQSPYHSQHYSSSSAAAAPSSMANQQQPRQTPTYNSAAEASSGYSSSPSNVYYGSFYQSAASTMNGIGGANGNSGNYGALNNNNPNHHPSHSSAHQGASSNFVTGPTHGVNVSSSHVIAPYPMANHSGYHLNHSGIYQRSHGGEFNGSMTQASEDVHPPPSQQQQHQQHYHHHAGSQHSGSPTLDGSDYGQGIKQKRRQVKNACINCQKACKRCDEGRPCSRCVKYGLTDTCQDSSRKERKRGIKRGPYKRRATTGSQSAPSYPPSSSFMVMEGLHNAPFLGHAHATLSPHLRSHQREQQQGLQQNSQMNEVGQGMENHLLHSPSYPASAPGTIQRTTAPLANNEAVYNRDHSHVMQPPRYTSRYDYDRTSNSPAQSLYNSNRSNALPPPVSAPATSTNFSSSPVSMYSSRSLFSPPALLSTTSANFLSANGHHRLHSDSSLNTLGSTTTASNSLSPRTPMSLNGSSAGLIGELGLMNGAPQTLSANSSSSSPGGINAKVNGNGYIHHPGPTTTTSLPLTATGAFLNPPTAPINNAQPFPLHIPHSARWRSNAASNGGERDMIIGRNRDDKEEQLAPIKLHSSTDSDISNGNLSIRYQLPSPRMVESPRNDPRNGGGLPKMDVVA